MKPSTKDQDLFAVKPDLRVRVVELELCSSEHLRQAAQVLVAAFKDSPLRLWTDLSSSVDEVQEARTHFALAAINQHGRLVGWLGAHPLYSGHVWQIRPLAVHPNAQRCGIGTALVRDLEAHASSMGIRSLVVSAHDFDGSTSLGGIDLYASLSSMRGVTCEKAHPVAFLQRLGFQVIGVLPEAHGAGKPRIDLGKRLI